MSLNNINQNISPNQGPGDLTPTSKPSPQKLEPNTEKEPELSLSKLSMEDMAKNIGPENQAYAKDNVLSGLIHNISINV